MDERLPTVGSPLLHGQYFRSNTTKTSQARSVTASSYAIIRTSPDTEDTACALSGIQTPPSSGTPILFSGVT